MSISLQTHEFISKYADPNSEAEQTLHALTRGYVIWPGYCGVIKMFKPLPTFLTGTKT